MIRSRVNSVPTATACLLAEIAEARGKQVLFTHQSPQVLKALRETALVKSVESSNRIEGIEVDPTDSACWSSAAPRRRIGRNPSFKTTARRYG